ncbi:hypothetical protein R6Z07F_002025 [Ovis aries]
MPVAWPGPAPDPSLSGLAAPLLGSGAGGWQSQSPVASARAVGRWTRCPGGRAARRRLERTGGGWRRRRRRSAMGSRAPHALVDTTPAKTIVVYRNGDQFYVGRKFVLSRRRVATFEALLEQLTEQVEVPFGVRRLFTPTRGRPVLELDSLQAGGKYVAAGRERFKKLDYINIVPRKPAKMRKLKEIKPVVHCGMSVPSRWQTFHRTSRQINVFTNGRLFIPPVKIIIPKFRLMEWNSVLATVGEKVFPLGGVRKLFTMNGHLLDNPKDLQDNHFYVAAGLEAFKNFPYWKSPKVPSEVQQKYTDMEKHSRRKKKEDPKVKGTRKQDSVSPEAQDSVFYAKEGKQKPKAEPLIQSGADGDVFKAQTPNQETQEAPEVKEAPDVHLELPVDRRPAEIVKDAEETHRHTSDFEGNRHLSRTSARIRKWFRFLMAWEWKPLN